MDDRRYQETQDWLVVVAGLVRVLDLDGFLQRIELAEAVGPILNPNVTKPYPRPDDLEPDQVAVALASGRGITWLAQELGIGSTKAGRVKQFADRMREKIEALGYALVPAGQL
jgi:hypothetical protein